MGEFGGQTPSRTLTYCHAPGEGRGRVASDFAASGWASPVAGGTPLTRSKQVPAEAVKSATETLALTDVLDLH